MGAPFFAWYFGKTTAANIVGIYERLPFDQRARHPAALSPAPSMPSVSAAMAEMFSWPSSAIASASPYSPLRPPRPSPFTRTVVSPPESTAVVREPTAREPEQIDAPEAQRREARPSLVPLQPEPGRTPAVSDAGHMATDALGLGMALAAIVAANKPSSDSGRTYGSYRMEILAALANAVLLFAVAGYVLFEAIDRFREPLRQSSGREQCQAGPE